MSASGPPSVLASAGGITSLPIAPSLASRPTSGPASGGGAMGGGMRLEDPPGAPVSAHGLLPWWHEARPTARSTSTAPALRDIRKVSFNLIVRPRRVQGPQSGCTLLPAPVDNDCNVEPSRSEIVICQFLPRLHENTRCRPLGAHEGYSQLPRPCVICRTWRVPRSMTAMSKPPASSLAV